MTKDTTSIAILEDFIEQFGATSYGSMARARLRERERAGRGARSAAGQSGCAGPVGRCGGACLGGDANTSSVAVIEDFIRQFGNTPYGSMARARLTELRKSQVAVATPGRPSPSAPPAGEKDDAACPKLIGTWTSIWTGDRLFRANGTITSHDGGTGNWTCRDGNYVLIMGGRVEERMKLVSSDKLSGFSSVTGYTIRWSLDRKK